MSRVRTWRRRLLRAGAVVVLLGATGPAAVHAPHPFHKSFAEMELNAETQRLEVSLSMAPLEVEQSLAAIHERKIDLERTEKIDELVAEWVAERFVVTAADGERAEPQWVGMEVFVKVVWVYFELPLEGGLEGAKVASRVLLKEQPEQLNTVVVRSGKARRTLTFTRRDPKAKFLTDDHSER